MTLPAKSRREALSAFDATTGPSIRPLPRMSLPEWADTYRRLSTAVSATGGPWRTSRVEIARGPMMAVKEPGVRTITVKSCTQLLKALDAQTPIPTLRGFVPLAQIEVGDSVFGSDGKPTRVTAVSPIYEGRECYKIRFSDHTSIIANYDHQWVVDDNKDRNVTICRRVVTTAEIAATWRNKQGRHRYAIPLAASITGKKKDLPVDPYSLGGRLFFGRQTRIPSEYMFASIEQRWELLRGLTGVIRSYFSTSNPQLRDDVLVLLWSLGFKPSIRTAQSFCLISWTPKVFPLSREIIGVDRVESRPVKCLAVDSPDHTYLCGRQMLITHNTSLLENIIGYHTHLDPCPMLLTQPKENAVKAFSKERLSPMVRATPVLAPLLVGNEARGDTLFYKEFPGGFLAMESAGSPTNLAMRAIRITLLDEIDKYETTKEGDPVLLAEERTSTFTDRSLRIRTCSPTWEETSRIEKSYQDSDQRLPFVSCPHCGYWQALDFFRHVQWQKSDEGEHYPYTAAIYCESCGVEWTESQRLAIMTTEGAIRWHQSRSFECCGEQQWPTKTRLWKWDAANQVGRAQCVHCKKLAVPNAHAGFTASKLYSPFITVPELAAKWLLCKDDPESKMTFYNTQLGLAFRVEILRKVDSHGLTTRCEVYPAQVPEGVIRLTAGVDVQAGSALNSGRLEIEVVGWGIGEESWSIDHKVLYGDPAGAELWNQLDEYLLAGFEHESGRRMNVSAVCVDSGGLNTQDVYRYCRARIGRNVWAIKGARDVGGQWSPVWPTPKLDSTKFKRVGYRPISIGTSAAKETIRQKLFVEEPGPGYCHFPVGRSAAWFEQLTSEHLEVTEKQGFKSKRWVLPRRRANEALDCRVYAYAALCGLYVRGLRLERAAQVIGSQIAASVEPKQEQRASPEPQLPPQPAPRAPFRINRQARRSLFVG